MPSPPPASRRTLLRAAGALTATAATALVPGAACADGAAHPAAARPTRRPGDLFDLGAPAATLFTDGAVLTAGSAGVRQYALLAGTDHTTVAVDVAHRQLTMRYARDGAFRYAVFPLDRVGRPGAAALADIAQPALPATFQGFASYGRWLYLLTGDAYGANGSTAPTGNTRIGRVDLGTGAVAEEVPVTAAPDLVYREPEGMAVRLAGGRPQLCFGYASGVVGDRRALVFALPAR